MNKLKALEKKDSDWFCLIKSHEEYSSKRKNHFFISY